MTVGAYKTKLAFERLVGASPAPEAARVAAAAAPDKAAALT